MTDWLEELSDEDRIQWVTFVDHFRRDAVEKIAGSEAFVSILRGKADVKFAAELGTAILLDKPILAVVHPDTKIPGKLRDVADMVVVVDIDTEAGRDELAETVKRFAGGLDG